MPWVLVTSSLIAATLWWVAARRVRRRQVVDGAPRRHIGELEPGRFRVTGKIVGMATSASPLDGYPCVYLEHADYSPVGAAVLLKETDRYLRAHPFYLQDATGMLLVDPEDAAVDAVTLYEDGGLTAERRLRNGEEVEVVARVAQVTVEAEGGPYRAGALAWATVPDDVSPTLISYRTDPSMVVPADEVAVLLRGAGLFLVAVSGILSALVLL